MLITNVLTEEVVMKHEQALKAARNGKLPADSEGWGLVDKYGWPVAHQIAQEGKLPEDFNQWELATDYGYTVAHVAAVRGTLPVNYHKLDQADRYGRTVRDLLVLAPKSDEPRYAMVA